MQPAWWTYTLEKTSLEPSQTRKRSRLEEKREKWLERWRYPGMKEQHSFWGRPEQPRDQSRDQPRLLFYCVVIIQLNW